MKPEHRNGLGGRGVRRTTLEAWSGRIPSCLPGKGRQSTFKDFDAAKKKKE
jgi:hypothetical protein